MAFEKVLAPVGTGDAAGVGPAAQLPKAGLANAKTATPRDTSAPTGPNVTRIQASDGPLVLPAATSIEQIRAAGPDLVITLPDGQVIVIVNGAVEVPELVVGNVRIPPANIAALLTSHEPAPAAGAPQSSGGNFAEEPGAIAAAFKIGELLDPTDFSLPQTERREYLFDQVDNRVDVTIATPNQTTGATAATATVAESGLPARDDLPAGSNHAASTEVTRGIIQIDAKDGVVSIFINDTQVTEVGETIETRYGELVIVSITPTEIGYIYVLVGNSTDPVASEVITVTVTDKDGDVGTATLTINLDDDAPTARPDVAAVAAGDFDAQVGNVITGHGTSTGATGVDTPGADGAEITAVHAGTAGPSVEAGAEVIGQYGVLVIDADGTFTYTRNQNTPGGVEDSFTYELTDGDGDKSTATIRFVIDDGAVSVFGVPEGDDATVNEAGLPVRGSESPGSDEASSGETSSGSIFYQAPDGTASIAINGQEIHDIGQIIETATGRLVITGIADGEIGYQFTLTDNVSGDFISEEFTVTVTDLDGDSDTNSFTISIIDDAPFTSDDEDFVDASERAAASGNVITDAEGNGGADTPGADGAQVTGVSFGGADSAVGSEIHGAYGVLIMAADGSYTYTIDPDSVRGFANGETRSEQFTYTLTDGDGDTATATLTIAVSGDGDHEVVIEGLAADGPDGTVAEAALPGGSVPDPSGLVTHGSFTISAIDGLANVTIGGETVFDGTPQAGTVIDTGKGLLEILSVTPETAQSGAVIGITISYSYTLSANTLLHTGGDDVALTESFDIVATDADGSQASDTLVVAITDDVPTTADDVADMTADAGATTGNVITDAEGNGGADTPGADGSEVTGVSFDGSDGGVGSEVHGAYGVLVLQADGSYTYTVDPDNALVHELGGGESLTEIFTYTLTDGDGDTAIATLTVNVYGANDGITVEGLAGDGPDGTVSEAALPDGSAPDADGLVTSGSFTVTAADGLATLTIGGQTVFNGEAQAGTVIDTGKGLLEILSVSAETGESGKVTAVTIEYSYMLTASAAHIGANDTTLNETFAVVATDTDGTHLFDSLVVAITDDTPTAHTQAAINVVEDAAPIGGNVLSDDTRGADGAHVTAVVIDGVQILVAASGMTNYTTAKGVYTFQANGAWTFDASPQSNAGGVNAGFTYTITDGDGDKSSAAQTITILDGQGPKAGIGTTLIMDEARLEDGSTPSATQPVHVEGSVAFTAGSDAIASITFGDLSQLDGSLDWHLDSPTSITGSFAGTAVVTLTLTVTGNTAKVSATLLDNYLLHSEPDADVADLGKIQVVATDTDGDTAAASMSIGIADDVPTITGGDFAPGALTVDESNLSQNATANFASLIDAHYNADGAGEIIYELSAGNGSGLTDVATGSPVSLRYGEDNGTIIGFVAGSPSLVVFTLSIDPNGQMTFDQQRAVRHPNGSNPDDAVTVIESAIKVAATVFDADGDFAQVVVDLSGILVFRDDGPHLQLAAVTSAIPTLTTHDALTVDTATDVASANFAGAFSIGSDAYGADGPGQIAWAYSLALGSAAATSGLTSNGVVVTLALVDGAIVGSAGGSPVFSIAVNAATGQVTLSQFAELDHAGPGSAGNYVDQIIALANNLATLKGTATITDRDGDSASQSLTIDLGGKIHFADGGPGVSVTGTAAALVVDETNMSVNATSNMASLFATTLNYGADGPGSINYALGATAGKSGLIDSLTGEAVVLSISGGIVYGKTETSGLEVLRISVSAGGVVSFDQSRSIMHTPDTGPDQALTFSGSNLVTLTATVTDGDGDTATATADITNRFTILDDAPRAIADVDTVARDGNNVADGNVLTGSGGVDLNETDGAADVLSADGNVRVVGIRFGIGQDGPVGGAVAGEHGSLTIDSHGFYRYSLTANDPAVIALASGQTLTETFTYTIEDRDGDRSSATITITISGTNDLPIARADTNWVLDAASGSDPTASGNVLLSFAHPGAPSGAFADVSDIDPDSDPLTVTNPDIYFGQYGTLVLAADGTYTYHLNEDNAAVNALDTGQKLTDTFNYTVTDGGLTGGSTLTITIFGTNDAPTIAGATARVSEEGLSGGVADSGPDSVLDTTNSTVATGMIGVADVDAGEALTITLGDPGAVLTAGGQPVVWSGVGTNTLTGSVGGHPVITITVDNAGAYTVTLSHSVDHPTINQEDLKSFSIPVQVSDGTVTTTNPNGLNVIIEDDRPTAIGEGGSSAQPHQNVNAMFILDFSNSIDDGELNKMIVAVKTALTQLDAATVHDLGIQLVIFSSSTIASPKFATAADANAWLAAINPADGGTRPDSIGLNTNYTAAIQTALANFEPVSGSNNQIVFISDGNPNSGFQFGGSPPTIVNSLQTATANEWNTFVDSHGIGVTAIGINNDPLSPINLQRLADVDLNDAPNNQPILIDNFDALMQTLVGVVVPPSFSGDLDANDLYGADGGHILSITVGATTYTWDGGTNISVTGGGHITGTTIAATTPQGGTLHLDFATGQYSYDPPSPITVTTTENFGYVLVDGDGDTASATLSVSISTSTPPIVLDLDGDGLEFVSAAAGAHYDFNGDGTAENTAWVGRDDGLLAIDANGDGKVTDRSEIVFAADGLTDLQGLAAKYDTNHDGVLDTKDADFAKFGVWQDANGDGKADPGEFTTLAERGITSLDLTGTGRSYTTADGQVLVHAESTYTLADGTTAKLADVAFATNVVQAQDRSATATSALGAAMLAAGLIATASAAAAEEPKQPDNNAPERAAPPAIEESAPAATADPTKDEAADKPNHLEPATPAHEEARPAAGHTEHGEAEPAHAQADQEPSSHAVADLLAPAVDIEALNLPANGGDQAPGFSATAAAPGPVADLDHGAAVAEIVTEALAEGNSDNPIDRLIDALKQSASIGDAGPHAVPVQPQADGYATLLQPLGDMAAQAGGHAIDWSAAHQVLAEQHVVVQLEAAAAGHG
jgi:VCBS repeat-containing protein